MIKKLKNYNLRERKKKLLKGKHINIIRTLMIFKRLKYMTVSNVNYHYSVNV